MLFSDVPQIAAYHKNYNFDFKQMVNTDKKSEMIEGIFCQTKSPMRSILKRM